MNEAETRAKRIDDPALNAAGWYTFESRRTLSERSVALLLFAESLCNTSSEMLAGVSDPVVA